MSKKQSEITHDLCRYNEGVVCGHPPMYLCKKRGFSPMMHEKRVEKIKAELNGVAYVETDEREER